MKSSWSKSKTAGAVVVLCAFLGACDKPTDAVLPTDSNQWTVEFTQKLKGLGDDEKQLLTGYIIRMKMAQVLGGSGIPVGTTVGQAIAYQKQWIAEKKAEEEAAAQLKQQLEAKQAAAEAELRKTIILTFLSQRYIPSNWHIQRYDDFLEIRIGIKNNGPKTLKGVRGKLVIKNTFGDIITKTRLNIEENISPGNEYVWTGGRKLNKFLDEDQKLMNLENGKFSIDVQPTLAVYDDGSTVGVTN